MRILGLAFFIAFKSILGASFSSSKDEEKVTEKSFPDYLGDREILGKIIAISGTVARRFRFDARCLDDILVEDHLYQLCSALYQSDLSGLGKLIRELSPERFDALCFRLDRAEKEDLIWSLVEGYDNRASRWKRASELQKGEPVTPENASIYRFMSEMLCDAMQSRPMDILTIECKNYCGKQWVVQKKFELVRKWIRECSDGQYLKRDVFMAFAEHPEELVEWLKYALKNGYYEHRIQILLPNVLNVEHLNHLKNFMASDDCASSPHLSVFFLDDDRQQLINEINNIVTLKHEVIPYDWSATDGFDPEPFMGEWPIAKSLNPHLRHLHRRFFMRGLGYPQMLNDAFSSALTYGDMEPLENTILLLTSLDPKADSVITERFWDWFGEEFDYSGSQPYLQRYQAIFARVKEHFTWTFQAGDADELWHHIALYEEILKSPSSYFPTHLESDGIDWAKSAIESFPKTAEEAEEDAEGGRNNAFFSYVLHHGWHTSARKALSTTFPADHLDSILFSQLSQLYTKDALRSEFAYKLISTLSKSLGWIALTSNHKLLDAYLELYSPRYIQNACSNNPALHRRITIMLHLSFKTASFLPDGRAVDKNSVFFRDWVMYRLYSKHKADLKLLDYYFDNRFHGRYLGYDLFSGNRVFGLLGFDHAKADPTRLLDLTVAAIDARDEISQFVALLEGIRSAFPQAQGTLDLATGAINVVFNDAAEDEGSDYDDDDERGEEDQEVKVEEVKEGGAERNEENEGDQVAKTSEAEVTQQQPNDVPQDQQPQPFQVPTLTWEDLFDPAEFGEWNDFIDYFKQD